MRVSKLYFLTLALFIAWQSQTVLAQPRCLVGADGECRRRPIPAEDTVAPNPPVVQPSRKNGRRSAKKRPSVKIPNRISVDQNKAAILDFGSQSFSIIEKDEGNFSLSEINDQKKKCNIIIRNIKNGESENLTLQLGEGRVFDFAGYRVLAVYIGREYFSGCLFKLSQA